MKKVDFISMENGTAEEYAFLDKLENQYLEDLPSRLIEALKALDCSLSGFKLVDSNTLCKEQQGLF